MQGAHEARLALGHELVAPQLLRFESPRLFVEKDIKRTPYNTAQSLVTEITRVFNNMPRGKVVSACSAFRKCVE